MAGTTWLYIDYRENTTRVLHIFEFNFRGRRSFKIVWPIFVLYLGWRRLHDLYIITENCAKFRALNDLSFFSLEFLYALLNLSVFDWIMNINLDNYKMSHPGTGIVNINNIIMFVCVFLCQLLFLECSTWSSCIVN